MPEHAKVAAYAAAGSIAAATLAYIFSPSIWPDVGLSSRRKGVVGIRNYGNDCFINSVLQALTASESLRAFLIAETARRSALGIDSDYQTFASTGREKPNASRGLVEGLVTASLHELLNVLSHRNGSSRNISNASFIRCLEVAFNTRISRRQQDAQEFLQIVAERLCDEHQALMKHLKTESSELRLSKEEPMAELEDSRLNHGSVDEVATPVMDDLNKQSQVEKTPADVLPQHLKSPSLPQASSFENVPFEGTLESQVECLTCHFKPKPTSSTFVCLTLNVPLQKSTTLDHCLDGLLKQEIIDDYICDRCRIEHAIMLTEQMLSNKVPSEQKDLLEIRRERLQKILEDDPEVVPSDLDMPESKLIPKRKISKYTRISRFPSLLAIHLSRSIFDPGSYSMKNMASVSFEERLRLGGFDRHNYVLECLITHQGGHNSGHYETFRKQLEPPITSEEEDKEKSGGVAGKPKKKARANKRWWRISDDRIGHSNLHDMLGMKKEAYILMYELVSHNSNDVHMEPE